MYAIDHIDEIPELLGPTTFAPGERLVPDGIELKKTERGNGYYIAVKSEIDAEDLRDVGVSNMGKPAEVDTITMGLLEQPKVL